MSVEKEIESFLLRPYQRVIIPDEEGGFTSTIQEFPGCIAEGETPAEAYENLERVARDWLEGALEQGLPVPLPTAANEYSGRVVVRLPRWLHRRAVEAAHNEHVSLNTFLVSSVAERLGEDRATQRLTEIARLILEESRQTLPAMMMMGYVGISPAEPFPAGAARATTEARFWPTKTVDIISTSGMVMETKQFGRAGRMGIEVKRGLEQEPRASRAEVTRA